jgi:hypothetical protein
MSKDVKTSITVLVAGVLLSAILISSAHFHKELLADSSCVLCVYKASLDAQPGIDNVVAINIALPIFSVEIPEQFIPIRRLTPEARSPPFLLVD